VSSSAAQPVAHGKPRLSLGREGHNDALDAGIVESVQNRIQLCSVRCRIVRHDDRSYKWMSLFQISRKGEPANAATG
jgi:hypothetical protein